MTLQLLVNNIDRTNDIVIDSLEKTDVLNSQKDELKFRILYYNNNGFIPDIGQDVKLYIDNVLEFGGIITRIDQQIENGILINDVICNDYTVEFDRKLVLERYDNKTIKEIIQHFVGKYCDDFTANNVDCDIEVATMVFNRLTPSACLDKLAKAVNYSWYIDYEKDVHFFSRNDNPAPFIIKDDNNTYIEGTLKISSDLSQLRNKVVIRGGEERGETRSETYIADGSQLEFPLAYKYAEMPDVKVDGVTKVVGVDFLTPEENADCFWNYQEKYIRFKDDTKPANGKSVVITGIPLFPIIVNVIDDKSIRQYGIYEFFKEDKSITSRAEALKYALAQLEAYKFGVIEGSFQTDKAGLRSGQILQIDSNLILGVEDFLIQKVKMNVLAKDKAVWNVSLATMRTMGIIQVLQDLIAFKEIREFDPDNLLSFYLFDDSMSVADGGILNKKTTSPPYKWGEDETNPLVWSFGTWY